VHAAKHGSLSRAQQTNTLLNPQNRLNAWIALICRGKMNVANQQQPVQRRAGLVSMRDALDEV